MSETHELDQKLFEFLLSLLLAQGLDGTLEASNVPQSMARFSCQPGPAQVLGMAVNLGGNVFEVRSVWNLFIQLLSQVDSYVSSHFSVHNFGQILESRDQLFVLRLQL